MQRYDARALAEATFTTARARAFFAGNAAHSMLPLERRPSGGFGLALIVLGHVYGWGFPRGGSQRIADALAEHGARTRRRDPHREPRRRAPARRRRPRRRLAARAAAHRARPAAEPLHRALERYRYGPAAFKLDWALDGRSRGAPKAVARAGTVHLGGTLDEISASEWAAWSGRHADRPFVLFAQHTRFDHTRAPAGKHTAWAYCHVPNGSSERYDRPDRGSGRALRAGFDELILARRGWPAALERRNRNLIGGDINGGAMDLGQLVTRPTRSRVPYRTPLNGVYLCSAATPPGGGVHGMCGWSARASRSRISLDERHERHERYDRVAMSRMSVHVRSAHEGSFSVGWSGQHSLVIDRGPDDGGQGEGLQRRAAAAARARRLLRERRVPRGRQARTRGPRRPRRRRVRLGRRPAARPKRPLFDAGRGGGPEDDPRADPAVDEIAEVQNTLREGSAGRAARGRGDLDAGRGRAR